MTCDWKFQNSKQFIVSLICIATLVDAIINWMKGGGGGRGQNLITLNGLYVFVFSTMASDLKKKKGHERQFIAAVKKTDATSSFFNKSSNYSLIYFSEQLLKWRGTRARAHTNTKMRAYTLTHNLHNHQRVREAVCEAVLELIAWVSHIVRVWMV